MSCNIYPADELAQIRAQIRKLKAREATLRAGFLDGSLVQQGHTYHVRITQSRSRVLVPARLPEDIRFNDDYYRQRVSKTVRLVTASEPEFSVIEPFEA